ncbi:unnamed protein product [Musa banksii]
MKPRWLASCRRRCDPVSCVSKLHRATASSLVNLYAKLGRMDYATRIADGRVEKSVVAMTAPMTGHLRMDDMHGASMVYRKIVDSGMEPTEKTIGGAVRAVSGTGFIRLGAQIHGYEMKMQFDLGDHLLSCLIHVDSLCGAPSGCSTKCLLKMWCHGPP